MIEAESIIKAAILQAQNIRGIYGKNAQLTLYVHSHEALRRILVLEGYKDLPFAAFVVESPEKVPDPCGIALAYSTANA